MFRPTILSNDNFTRVLNDIDRQWGNAFQQSKIAENDYLSKFLLVYFYQGALNARRILPNNEFEILTFYGLMQHFDDHLNDPNLAIKLLEDAVDGMFKKIKININSNDAKAFKQSVIDLANQKLNREYSSTLQKKTS